MLAGFGNGLEDGGWNAWIGNMQNANELLGFLHGAYGLGATISPCECKRFQFSPPAQNYLYFYVFHLLRYPPTAPITPLAPETSFIREPLTLGVLVVATSMVTKGNLPWYNFYYLMVSSISPRRP